MMCCQQTVFVFVFSVETLIGGAAGKVQDRAKTERRVVKIYTKKKKEEEEEKDRTGLPQLACVRNFG